MPIRKQLIFFSEVPRAPSYFFYLTTPFHPPHTFVWPLYPCLYLSLPPSTSFPLSFLIITAFTSRIGVWFCFIRHYLGSLTPRSQWVLYNGKSCKTANLRSDTALVVFSKLGRDHNHIYMIMKSEELWRSCLDYISVNSMRTDEEWSAFTLTSVAVAEYDRVSSHNMFYFSF